MKKTVSLLDEGLLERPLVDPHVEEHHRWHEDGVVRGRDSVEHLIKKLIGSAFRKAGGAKGTPMVEGTTSALVRSRALADADLGDAVPANPDAQMEVLKACHIVGRE